MYKDFVYYGLIVQILDKCDICRLNSGTACCSNNETVEYLYDLKTYEKCLLFIVIFIYGVEYFVWTSNDWNGLSATMNT